MQKGILKKSVKCNYHNFLTMCVFWDSILISKYSNTNCGIGGGGGPEKSVFFSLCFASTMVVGGRNFLNPHVSMGSQIVYPFLI